MLWPMKLPVAPGLAALLFLQAGAVRAEDTPTDVLLSRLGSDSYAEREKASLEFWKRGDAGLAILRHAAEGDDPEVVTRAKQLIRKIDLGIQPDSPPEVIELVMAYDKGGPADRRRILDSLKRMKAYRQILKLYATEKDESFLPMLSGAVEGVAMEAARQSLAAEPPNPTEALSFLTMARPGAAEWMAVASIHRSMGTLDQELKSAAADKSPFGPVRRYTLLAAAGRVGEAAEAAEKAGMQAEAWRMHVLDGDPLPWLRGSGAGEDEIPADGLGEYRDWVIHLWETGAPDMKFAPRFLALASSGDEDRQAAGISFLLLTRDYATAEKILLKARPMEAFSYFESAERLDEAIAALGLDPAKPDFTSWAAKQFSELISKPEDSDTAERNLRTVGGFLAEHGLAKELREAYTPGLEKLLAADESRFFQLCFRLFNGNDEEERLITAQQRVIAPIFDLLPKYGKEDDAKWLDALQSILGPKSSGPALWTWLGELEPALSRAQRAEQMARLLGLLPDKEGLTRGFLTKAWEALGKANAADSTARLNVLAQVANRSGDPNDYNKVIDAVLDKGLDKEDFTFRRRLYASLLGDWKKTADYWQEAVKENPADPRTRAYLSASLNRAGDLAGAAREEAMANRLCLGDSTAEYLCWQAFQYGSDFERASRWLRQAVMDCTIDGGGFPLDRFLLQDALDREDWKVAAAVAEVMAFDYARRGTDTETASGWLQLRVEADTARALARISSDPKNSRETLASVQGSGIGGANLADHFFPGLRAAGMTKEHDEWFEQFWKQSQGLMKRYPDADNMMNSIAWTCARANRHVDEGEAILKRCLELRPHEPNYLDSMGEIWFDRKDRAKAMEWSRQANLYQPIYPTLMKQYVRFQSEEFPPP
ncbi:MAG: hypothetical protein JWO82_3080 [Akkermansiaceae bacterium]|nr:hypothetical protein [Akkermansiaceae bacterium]